MLRHSRTCKQKNDRPTGSVKHSRKRKAYNACALGRVACDEDSPCETCLFKGLNWSCSCLKQLQGTGHDTLDPETSELHPRGYANCSGAGIRQRSQQRISVSFLLNCTHNFHQLLSRATRGCFFGPMSHSGQFTETWPFLFHAFINPSPLDATSRDCGLLYGFEDYPSLSKTSEELFRCLNQAPVPYAHDEESYHTRACAFVSEANIMSLVNAFFRYAYNSNHLSTRPRSTLTLHHDTSSLPYYYSA